MFTRRNRDCDNHEWVTTVHSGLRRDLCVTCGKLRVETVEVVTTRLPIFAEALKGAQATTTLAPFGVDVSED